MAYMVMVLGTARFSFMVPAGLRELQNMTALVFFDGHLVLSQAKTRVMMRAPSSLDQPQSLWPNENIVFNEYSFGNLSLSLVPDVMRIALLVFGQFRTWKYNLKANLRVMRTHMLHADVVDVFLLTERTGGYSEANEKEIRKIFDEFDFTVVKMWFWEDFEHLHHASLESEQAYERACSGQMGFARFVGHQWFRRYTILNLFSAHARCVRPAFM